ncbi:uncharacterized protein LOC111914961 [Lactuca sativa]|uniref:uncharacterized protein LOC111914961 n=1 Tax=Lactuca sativa TaxID=4236 RepID=UPI000CD8F1F8|nr:uncharacterized protein LOC111914961 [Lactuca sativa]
MKVNDLFDAVSRLLNIIRSSYKQRGNLGIKQANTVMEALVEGELESGTGLNQEVGIKRPSDTRWGSHFSSLLNIKNIYSSICEVNNLHHYHVDVFKVVIDMQIQELNHSFREANTKLLLCIACLCPRESFKVFDLDKLMEMTTLYREEFRTKYDLQVLEVELKNYIKDVQEDERFNQLKSIGELAKKMIKEKSI